VTDKRELKVGDLIIVNGRSANMTRGAWLRHSPLGVGMITHKFKSFSGVRDLFYIKALPSNEPFRRVFLVVFHKGELTLINKGKK